ncbi:MAG: DsrE family protein [Clostridia bacterium]|nr:DsrE family protein [Clostridia bacterium]
MRIGIIIETKEYEKAWNAMRLAVTAKKRGHEVKVFLMGEGVVIENIADEHFDISSQIKAFHEAGGKILACGTCLQSRNLDGTAACPISTMNDCVDMVEWADKVITL